MGNGRAGVNCPIDHSRPFAIFWSIPTKLSVIVIPPLFWGGGGRGAFTVSPPPPWSHGVMFWLCKPLALRLPTYSTHSHAQQRRSNTVQLQGHMDLQPRSVDVWNVGFEFCRRKLTGKLSQKISCIQSQSRTVCFDSVFMPRDRRSKQLCLLSFSKELVIVAKRDHSYFK